MTVGVLLSLLFQFAVRQGVFILVQCLAVNMRFSLTTFNEGAGNVFLWLGDVRHTEQAQSLSLNVEGLLGFDRSVSQSE
jgi:hypothetical protein